MRSASAIASRGRCSILLSTLQKNILNYYHTNPTSSFPPLNPNQNHHHHPNLLLNPKSSPHLPLNPMSPPNLTSSLDFYTQATVLETLSSYSSDWQRALEFFNWVEIHCGFHHTTETYNQLIDILGKFFEFDKCWELIAKMHRHELSMPNHATFRVMFKRYISAHLTTEAINMFDKLDEFSLRDDVSFSNLIDALCEYKHVVEAEELCFKEKNENGGGVVYDWEFDMDTKFHNMILRGWSKLGRWSKCREFWEEMDRRGVKKDLHSYSIYMVIQCKSGKPWKAVKLYKEMKQKGIRLDVVAYNTVIQAIGITDGVDVALRLFKEMIELRCDPNVVTYNTILKLYCQNGRYREAHKLLNEMWKRGCEPNVITYHCFFGCLEKPKEILRLFDRMIESGVEPVMDTYVMLMRKFGRWGFLRPVLDIWKKMEERGLSPSEFAYNALIDALVQKGMIDLARKYDEEMLEKGLSAKPRAELGTRLIVAGSENVYLQSGCSYDYSC